MSSVRMLRVLTQSARRSKKLIAKVVHIEMHDGTTSVTYLQGTQVQFLKQREGADDTL